MKTTTHYDTVNQKTKLKAVLSKTTTDKIKSKLLSPNLAEITFDVYLDSPTQFSDIIGTYYDQEFVISIEGEV